MFFRLASQFRQFLPSRFIGNSLRSKQNALLRILSLSRSQRIDPKTLIQNLAAEHPGSYGRKLMSLQRWIAADSSMSAALAHTPGVLTDDDALAIQCGIETNTLDETFEFILQNHPGSGEAKAGEIIRNTLGYVIAVLCFALLVILFLMVFIVPTFAEMFDEFGMQLPVAMSTLVTFCNQFAVIAPLVLLVAVGIAILFLFEDFRRFLSLSPLGRLLPARWARQSAGLLRLLALPTQLGQPVAPTLTAAAQFHPDRRCRRRLLIARTESESDSDIWVQLARQRLITKNQGEQLSRISSPTLRAWTLATLSYRTRDSASHRTEFIARIVQHIPIIFLGLFVGWIAVAVMQTLTNLIGSLA